MLTPVQVRGRILSVILLAALWLSACNGPVDVELPVTPGAGTPGSVAPAPTDLPPGPKTLVVCLGSEPESLYLYSPLRLYGAASRETDTVLQAVYDGPYDLRGYQAVPTILEKLPDLADGDARIEAVAVRAGDVYLNPESLLPETLSFGRPYLPSGCTDLGCRQTYQGGQVSLDRMVVEFHLLPNVRWSDGQPLTAVDSVYSFQLDADGETPSSKYLVNRTYSYEAVDERTVRWTGIAGFLDAEYATNFWSPLPQHLLAGMTAEEVLEDETANRSPIGWGPFVLESWAAGREIVFRRNPAYFRAAEGLPLVEIVLFRFVGSEPQAGVQQLLTGECDILDETAIPEDDLDDLVQQSDAGRIVLAATPGPLVERIDFHITQRSTVVNLLASLDTRRALAACVDRQALVDDLLFGLGAVTDSYLPPNHPLYAAAAAAGAGPTGSEMLQALGWVEEDADPSTPRVARGVPGIPAGTPLAFQLTAASTGLDAALAERLQAGWQTCGAAVEIDLQDPAALLAPWPEGPAFGRAFEAVVWPWLASLSPACEMFASWEIASDEVPFGSNASGFRSQDYDQACRSVVLGVPGGGTYLEAAGRTQAILADQLPSLPLFVRPRLAAHRPEVCGLQADASVFSLLWNLEGLDIGEACRSG